MVSALSQCKIYLCDLGADCSSVWQRLPVAGSCIIFAGLLSLPQFKDHSHILFAVLAVFACLEKVAATANTVAVERDWVSHIFELPHCSKLMDISELPGCHRIRGRRHSKTK